MKHFAFTVFIIKLQNDTGYRHILSTSVFIFVALHKIEIL